MYVPASLFPPLTLYLRHVQLGLLLWWIIDDDHKVYKIDEDTVVFISDVGAAHRVSPLSYLNRRIALG